MEKNAAKLEEYIRDLKKQYGGLSEEFTSFKLDAESWSIREIFGHLVDSAANNYQRFIRLQEQSELDFPGYDFNWIKIVKYNSYPFERILNLWAEYNLLLCHIFRNLDDSKLENCWLINSDRLTLRFLVTDYIDHLEIHIDQLRSRSAEVQRLLG